MRCNYKKLFGAIPTILTANIPDLEKKFNRKQSQLFVEDLKKKIAEKINR